MYASWRLLCCACARAGGTMTRQLAILRSNGTSGSSLSSCCLISQCLCLSYDGVPGELLAVESQYRDPIPVGGALAGFFKSGAAFEKKAPRHLHQEKSPVSSATDIPGIRTVAE
ncbi:hypothetical protein BV20DRAFT_504701 [Pilatotrama ljubarskyi]|nr:hypothetical protein BV20DRAFT_504701 [Pilatotrama ljubarskyi]